MLKRMHIYGYYSGRVYPCWGSIYAISGTTGQVKWTLNTRSEVFLFNCEDIDADGDGKMDCIATGRQATTMAFNPRTGANIYFILQYRDILLTMCRAAVRWGLSN